VRDDLEEANGTAEALRVSEENSFRDAVDTP